MAETVKETTPAEDLFLKNNDPAKVGAETTRRSLARDLASNTQQRKDTQQDYNAGYQGLKTNSFRNFRSALEGSGGLSGGMAQGRGDALSALEMGEMGNLLQGRERALRDVDTARTGIESNALLEGQQARDMAFNNQGQDLERQQLISSIVGAKSKDISDEQKIQQLKTLGKTDAEIAELMKDTNPRTAGQNTAFQLASYLPGVSTATGITDMLTDDKKNNAMDYMNLIPGVGNVSSAVQDLVTWLQNRNK